MDAIQKRIRTLQERIERLDEMDVLVATDLAGHRLFELFGSETAAVKATIINQCLAEIESLRRAQKWSAWTSGANKEAIVQ